MLNKEDNIDQQTDENENHQLNFPSVIKPSSTMTKPNTSVYGLPKVWYSTNANTKPIQPHRQQITSFHPQQQQQQQIDTSPADSPENDTYSGISVDTKPIIMNTSTSVKKWTTSSNNNNNNNNHDFRTAFRQPPQPPTIASIFKSSNQNGFLVGKQQPYINQRKQHFNNQHHHHSPPSINEYIDDHAEEEASSDSTNTGGSNTTTTTDEKMGIFKWTKPRQLVSNETISMDVDDEKAEGILV